MMMIYAQHITVNIAIAAHRQSKKRTALSGTVALTGSDYAFQIIIWGIIATGPMVVTGTVRVTNCNVRIASNSESIVFVFVQEKVEM